MRTDVKLARIKFGDTTRRAMVRVNLPTPLSVALIAKGYDRATVELVAEGILVKPYVSEDGKPREDEVVEIPDW